MSDAVYRMHWDDCPILCPECEVDTGGRFVAPTDPTPAAGTMSVQCSLTPGCGRCWGAGHSNDCVASMPAVIL